MFMKCVKNICECKSLMTFAKIMISLLIMCLHLTAAQDSETIKFSSSTAADELWLHVLECGALSGRYRKFND
jgi:hypothetical protein